VWPAQRDSKLMIEPDGFPCDNQLSKAIVEVSVPLRLLVAVLTLHSLAWAGSFDQPVFKRTVDLGPSKSSTGTRVKVTCYFFPHFMVKQVDAGEKGAERLAIVPGKIKDHTCSRLRDQGEKEINSDEWTGYFKGVKGDLVFFDADDGVNGGMGFAVFSAKTGKKVFDDVALGPLQLSTGEDKSVTMTYTRLVEGDCVIPKEQAACWDKIKQKLALDNAAPDCKGGYEKSAQEMAKGRCQAQKADNPECLAKEIALARQQANDSPSVISYPVEVVLSSEPAIKPANGKVGC
jgi:hypothetical protein